MQDCTTARPESDSQEGKDRKEEEAQLEKEHGEACNRLGNMRKSEEVSKHNIYTVLCNVRFHLREQRERGLV